MSKARNLADLLEAGGDVKLASLDNAPAPSKSTIDALGIAATSVTGTQASDIIANNAKVSNIDFDSSVLENNIAMLAFHRAADNSLSLFKMVDSVVDTYTDNSGIDTTASLNETLSSGAYSGASTSTPINATLSTANVATYDISINVLSRLFDGVLSGSQAIHTDSSDVGAWLRYDFGSAQGVSEWKYHIDSGAYGVWQLQYSDDTSVWTDVGSTFGGHPASNTWYSSGDVSAAGAHRYWRSYKTDSAVGGNYHQELDIYTYNLNILDLTLISTTTVALTVPSTGDVVTLIENAAGTATLNTDIKGYVSRDGGTTWTQGTLIDEGNWGTNKKILAFHNLDISAQPSGSNMRYKVTTHNQSAGKETRVHATSLAWA